MTKEVDKRYIDPLVIDEVLTRRVAALACNLRTVPSIMRTLGLSRAFVEEIQASPKYKEIIEQIGDDETKAVIAKSKRELQKSADLAVKLVRKAIEGAMDGKVNMREGLQASQLVLKAAGLHEEGEKSNDTSITVVLPSGVEPKTFEVTNETNEDPSEV